MNIKASVRVSLNTSLIAEIEGKAKENALFKTADWCVGEVKNSGKVPKMTGELEGSGFPAISVEARGMVAQVIFDTPYARRWYFNQEGAEFSKNHNPNAQDHWMDDFIHGDRRQELIDKFAEFYREELGGVLK